MKSPLSSFALLTVSVGLLSGCGAPAATPSNPAESSSTSVNQATTGNASSGDNTNASTQSTVTTTPTSNSDDASVAVTVNPPSAMHASGLSSLNIANLDAVDAISSQVAFFGGHDSILKTIDGGKTYAKVYNGKSGDVVDVSAVDENHVWAATSSSLLASSDGLHFKTFTFPTSPNVVRSTNHITDLDMVDANDGYVLNNGVVWYVIGGTAFERRTPDTAVGSMAFVNANVGYASSGPTLYKTSNGGVTWTKVFTANVSTDTMGPWKSHVEADGGNVWFNVYGGGAGMNQLAYVIYHSSDGNSFGPVLDEGYFATLYGYPQLAFTKGVGSQPGPFGATGSTAFFMGWQPDMLLFTETTNNGGSFKQQSIMDSMNPKVPDFFSPMAVDFVDATHGFVVGTTRAHHAQVLVTSDGGTTWYAATSK